MAESKTEQIKEQSHYLRETIRETLRSDASDEEAIQEYLKTVVLQKEDRHHIGEPEFVQPLMKRLGVESMARAGFYFYNTTDEIDHFVDVVCEVQKYIGN